MCADRALTAARESGNPRALGEAAKATAIAMRRSGRYDGAVDLLTRTADGLDVRAGSSTLAVYGTLMLTASYSAAQQRCRGQAEDLLAEAAGAAARMPATPEGGVFATEFNQDQVHLYGVSVHHALGDDVKALDEAKLVRTEGLRTPERRARYGVDLARAYWTLGDSERCYQALLVAERYAPEDVRRPPVRAIVADLLYAPGAQLPGLRGLAGRVGAAA